MANALKLGLLDFGARSSGQTPNQAVNETIYFARKADELGYTRYWLAEHQTPSCAWGSPEIILPLLTSNTSNIRVGTAGILLQVYNPLKVASDFSLLEHLFPDRIDLGIARGLPAQNKDALINGTNQISSLDNYADKIDDLIKYLTDSVTDSHKYPGAKAIPFPPRSPEVWILGSSDSSMKLASRFGTAFGYSLFHSHDPDPTVIKDYVADFQHSNLLSKPKASVAFAGVCAETDEKAQIILEKHQNQFIIPTVVGSLESCRNRLRELQQVYETTEFIFLDISQNFADKLNSYKLMIKASDF